MNRKHIRISAMLVFMCVLACSNVLHAAQTCGRQCLVDVIAAKMVRLPSAEKKEALKPSESTAQLPPPGTADPEIAELGCPLMAVPNTCEGQITAGVWAYITEIKNRRLLVIDEQKGLAVGFSNLYHDSKLKEMKFKGVPGVDSVPSYKENSEITKGELRHSLFIIKEIVNEEMDKCVTLLRGCCTDDSVSVVCS